jgi:membrane-associated phospholipid phosphatase
MSAMTSEAFWLAITTLGSDLVFIAVLALYGWLVRPGGIRVLGLAFALSYLVNTALKYGLNLPRPFTGNPDLAGAAAKATAGGPGLPSGHAQLSATLWVGVASQVQRRWVWFLAAALVALVSASRLVLNVHYPSDITVGLVLGVVFGWLAALSLSGRRALTPNWYVSAALLILACLLPARVPEEYSRGLGLLAGFWLAAPRYQAPASWPTRMGVALGGLVVVIGSYLALGALAHLLPEAVQGPARALRYFALVLIAVTGVPALFRTWMRPLAASEASVLPAQS